MSSLGGTQVLLRAMLNARINPGSPVFPATVRHLQEALTAAVSMKRYGLAALFLGGCSAAPSQSILGSFFPTWMFCALLGVVVALVAHRALVWAGVADRVPAPLLVYLAISIAGAFAFWLIWLG